MKKILLSAFTLFVSVFTVNAQEKLTEDQQEVQQAVTDMFQALADRDINKLKTHCTPDILILENGIAWNVDTLSLKLSQPAAVDFNRVNVIDFIETKINENVAWTTYNNQADITGNGKHIIKKWLETAILVKEDKRWKIKTLHSTLIKRG